MGTQPERSSSGAASWFFGRRRFVPALVLCVLAAGWVAATGSGWLRIAGLALFVWFAIDVWRYWTNPVPRAWTGDTDD
jgi:hypothetical protein